ncbi:MAG: YqaA family protein [Pseudomonadota bacterium]
MTMFSVLYRRVLEWARHEYAVWYLAILSFAESSFFPIPPDVMLAPMSLARPHKATIFALLTTSASVLGGIFGYAIGFFAFETIHPWLQETSYWGEYVMASQWFDKWGFWAVFVAGFSPIPYKVFTISAGALEMTFPPFVIASFIGRGARFFLLALLLARGGKRLESMLQTYINRIGWSVVALTVVGIGFYNVVD